MAGCKDGSRHVLSYKMTTLSAEVVTPGGGSLHFCAENHREQRALIALVTSHVSDAMFQGDYRHVFSL